MRAQRKPKKSDSTSKLVLEEIIGLTTKNANGLSANMLTGDCVYLAGCVVVVYNVETGNQSHLMVSSRVPKPLTCVAVSNQDGGIVAAGESGHQPAVLVWDYSSRVLIAELKVHRYGVTCIAFSPDGKHLVSVGFPHDGYFCLWDWRNGRLVTKLKSSSSCSVISSVSFSSDAKFFVTVGKKHMKFWTVESSIRSLSNVGGGLPTMDGKSANLGCQKGSSFISVASSTWTAPITGRDRSAEFYPIYALTDTGILCLFGSGFTMGKWVDLKVDKGFTLAVSNTLIACGCNNGLVQLFTSETLSFSGSLQISELKETQTHTSRDMTYSTKSADRQYQFDAIIPDAIACQFATSEKLVVVYGDHSLHVWDVRDAAKVSRCSVLVAHSACIWDVKNLSCENMHDPTLACVARGCCGGVSFATCSTDGTIRLWDLALRIELKTVGSEVSINDRLDENSTDTEKVGAMHLVGAGIFERDIVESGVSTTEGFRSMAVSSDGRYLASGDSQGNLHVYNLYTADYTCIQAAHEAEILSLTFSVPSKNSSHPGHYLLASGGKDRMIHLYDVERNFELIESLDDHSAAVTSVKLTCNGCKILSCSADRSLVFRDVAISDIGCNTSRCHHQLASNGTVYDMAIDPATEVAVTVGQDKKINTFSISSGKLVKTFKQDRDFGEPIKVSMDPSCSYLVCSYSNKSMCIYDFTNGELVTQVVGHGEVITGVIFLPDCKHIVSVGGDGCIFVWKLPSVLSAKMLQRVMERTGPLSPSSMLKKGVSSGSLLDKTVSHPFDQEGKRAPFEQAPGFRFSISRLPSWAQTKVTTKEILPAHLESIQSEDSDLGDSAMRPSDVSNSSRDSNNRGSPIADNPSFGMDERWLTIHTVYHDPLESPNRLSLEGMAEVVSSPNILDKQTFDGPNEDESIEIKSEDPIRTDQVSLKSPLGPNEHIVNDTQHPLLDKKAEEQCPILDERFRDGRVYNLCENKDPNGFYIAPECCKISVEQRDLESRDIIKEDNTEKSHQEDDLFRTHFSNLSSALKTETGQPSNRRSYSARFVVRRDHLSGCKRLFETFNQSSVGELFNSPVVTSSHVSDGDSMLRVLEKSHPSDACKQDVENTTETMSNPAGTLQHSDLGNYTLTDLIAMEQINVKEPSCMSEEIVMEKRITNCQEALLKLDAAAGNTLQLWSDLRSVISKEDAPSKSVIEFYDWAEKFLPKIGEKFQSLGELVQSTSTCSNEKMEDSRFEPLVEKFAESLSRQVLELVKKSL